MVPRSFRPGQMVQTFRTQKIVVLAPVSFQALQIQWFCVVPCSPHDKYSTFSAGELPDITNIMVSGRPVLLDREIQYFQLF